ncbi:MAG: ribosome-associated translation inhibitor RaiA [Anaerolineae bacterium]|nr:ribosome-associated translation inhibitor RaiA [Anaerolineae bacterium]
MELRIINRHAEVSDTLRNYIEKKMVKFDRQLPNLQDITVEVSTQTSRSQGEMHVAQVTMHIGREVLRAEVQDTDAFEAIDAMLAKLQRQVERYRGKRQDRWHGRGNAGAVPATVELETEEMDVEEEAGSEPVVRRKRFAVYPMGEAEAIEQMELLGHDFFLYRNPASGQVNLIYRRRGGGYGILEPEMA